MKESPNDRHRYPQHRVPHRRVHHGTVQRAGQERPDQARSALDQLPERPDAVLLDGKHDYIGGPWPVRTAVQADLRSVSVAAASVIAKEYRDAAMAKLGEGYPEFAFADNAGYPAPVHQEALAKHGPTPYHRLSWSYLDDLPQWRHLRIHRPAIEGQLTLL